MFQGFLVLLGWESVCDALSHGCMHFLLLPQPPAPFQPQNKSADKHSTFFIFIFYYLKFIYKYGKCLHKMEGGVIFFFS